MKASYPCGQDHPFEVKGNSGYWFVVGFEGLFEAELGFADGTALVMGVSQLMRVVELQQPDHTVLEACDD